MKAKPERSYDKDFYAWAIYNAALIRQGKFAEVDLENVAEEIESMGRSDKRQLINRLAVLIAHLLKWQHQPERQSNSWKLTIEEQRIRLQRLLNESPSLNHELEQKIDDAYKLALVIAVRQTGLPKTAFPKKCPYKLSQCFDEDFLPE